MLDRARSMLLNRAKETVNENYIHKIIGSSVLKSTGNCHNFSLQRKKKDEALQPNHHLPLALSNADQMETP